MPPVLVAPSRRRAETRHLPTIYREREPPIPNFLCQTSLRTLLKVVCINVAKRENSVNSALTKAAGLEDKVVIPGEKSFFDTGMPDSSCDVVLSQDSLLHAGSQRHRALAEAARVLKPGGKLVFTDIMQSEEAEAKDLQEVRGGETRVGGMGGRTGG